MWKYYDISSCTSAIRVQDLELFFVSMWYLGGHGRIRMPFLKIYCNIIFFSRGMSSEKTDAFRVWFSRIGELRSLIPSANMIALTATASKTLRTQIERKLHMIGCVEIVDSPDRSNIKLFREKVSASQELSITFNWIIKRLRNSTLPRMLIFSKSIADCSLIYNMCRSFRDINMKQVDMFHSQTPKDAKDHIMKDMANVDGTIKLLSCTNAAGMGINFKGVNMVVSYGPPQDMDTFVQHVGWAGRDGVQSSHLLVYYGRQVRNLNSDMIKYLKTEGCLRTAMLSSYNAKSDLHVGHLCCTVCTETCECGEDTCKTAITHPGLQDEINDDDSDDDEDDSDDDEDEQKVSEDEKKTISALLEIYFCDSLTTESYFSFLDSTKIGKDIISSVLSKLQTLQSPTDVLEQTIVGDYNVAKEVFSVIADVLKLDNLDVLEEDDESDLNDDS